MMRVRAAFVTTALIAVSSVVAGCGGTSDSADPSTESTATVSPTPQPSPTKTATSAALPSTTPTTQARQIIRITIGADSSRPRGTRFKVKRGEPVFFDVTAVQAGELHAHSTPEQQLAYTKGNSTGSLTFDQPGIIEVEDHRLGKLVVQLEVR